MSQNILLEKQKALQKQADDVLNDLGLVSELSKYGEVKIVGSVALGLMTWPDIDINLISQKGINDSDYFEMIKFIFSQKYIKQLILIDNRSSFEKNRPQSMYIGIIYDLSGVNWKIDIRYLDPAEAWADKDVEIIKGKLTEESIKTILEIKTAFHNHPKYRKEFSGYDIYNAVLNNNVSKVEAFSDLLKNKGVKL